MGITYRDLRSYTSDLILTYCPQAPRFRGSRRSFTQHLSHSLICYVLERCLHERTTLP